MKAHAMVAAILLAGATALRAAGDVPESGHKVEYARVDGTRCVQPTLHAAHARLADYRAAELRWLESNHPGVHVSHWDVNLLVDPAPNVHGETADSTVLSDTAHLDDVVGQDATVCFDVNVKDTDPKRQEQARHDVTRR